jgi:hypothetical protein
LPAFDVLLEAVFGVADGRRRVFGGDRKGDGNADDKRETKPADVVPFGQRSWLVRADCFSAEAQRSHRSQRGTKGGIGIHLSCLSAIFALLAALR